MVGRWWGGGLQNKSVALRRGKGREAGSGGHSSTSVVMGGRIKKRLSEGCRC